MFNFLQRPFGLDISTQSIKVISLVGSEINPRLVAMGQAVLTQDTIEKGRVKDKQLLSKQITDLVADPDFGKIRNRYCIFSLPDYNIFTHFFQLPDNIKQEKKIEFIKKENGLSVKRSNEEKKTKSIHGLYRQLINNAVLGVQKLWEKRLKIVGTGYTVKLDKDDLVFKIGYSHPVIFKKVPGIKFQVEGNNKAVVLGSDKQLVGQVAYQIKILKKPDVYKGKGIQYEGEKLRIKPGKKVKAAGAAAA